MIPDEYLSKMDGHSVEVQGVELKVKVVDLGTFLYSDSLLNAYINNIKYAFKTGPRVVGVDIVRCVSQIIKHRITRVSLVLCGGPANCLVVHLSPDCAKAPEALLEFMEDSTICFVGSTTRPSFLVRESSKDKNQTTVSMGVEAGNLASRVLKDPTLYGMSLKDLSHKVGVDYEPSSYVTHTGTELKVLYKSPRDLTEKQVKAAVNDAYAYFRIGHKLISSL